MGLATLVTRHAPADEDVTEAAIGSLAPVMGHQHAATIGKGNTRHGLPPAPVLPDDGSGSLVDAPAAELGGPTGPAQTGDTTQAAVNLRQPEDPEAPVLPAATGLPPSSASTQ